MTKYQIRNSKLSQIFVVFDSEKEAARYWHEHVETDTSSLRKGAVMGRFTCESLAEAEQARLDWLGLGWTSLPVSKEARSLIDSKRPKIDRVFVQLLPVPHL